MAADGFDPSFTLVPPDPGTTPDAALEAALSGLLPDNNPDVPRPFGRGWAFDFQAGEFVGAGITPAEVSGLSQLEVWVEKTLRTARLAHPIYDDEYGVDDPWIGIGFAFSPRIAAAMAQQIQEALLIHDRITTVQNFSFDGGTASSVLVVFFTVTTDEDEELDFQIPVGRPGG